MRDTTRAQLVENWKRDDPRLSPDEKETTIRFARDEDRATVHTDEAGIGRRLLAHPDTEVEEVTVLADGRVRRVSPEEVVENDEPVGLRASLPVGALKVRSTARKSSQHSAVISETVLDELPEPEAVTDGGRYVLPSIGSRVRDRQSEDGDELVVIDVHPETRAGDYRIEAIDATVAEVNGEYDQNAPVVEAVYVEESDQRVSGWRSVEDLVDAVEFDALNSYSFPADRLAGTGGRQ